MKVLGLPSEQVTAGVKRGDVTLCVVGLGYVGLPLATLFALEGARVIGCDKRPEVVEKVMLGESPLQEHDVSRLLRMGAQMLSIGCPNCGVKLAKYEDEIFCPACGRRAEAREGSAYLTTEVSDVYSKLSAERTPISERLRLVIQNGRLHVTTDTVSAVKESDVILVCVGTPISEDLRPDYKDLLNACEEVGKGLKRGDLIILKSTVSPGTTEDVVGPILERESGLKIGRDFGLANSPERIKEGYALFEFRTVPRNVSGVTRESGLVAASVFGVFPAEVHVFDSPRVTETAKLFENIYRDVNIALVNELALVCEKLKVDVMKAIEAARTDPKTNLLLPGPGVGGYCLPKDPYYLVAPAMEAGFEPKLTLMARRINDSMPLHIVELVKEAFDEMHMSIKGKKIAILGLAFKGNSSDTRNTPVKTIAQELSRLGAAITVQDPYVDLQEAKRLLADLGLELTRDICECITGSSCLVLATDHLEYSQLDLSKVSEMMAKRAAIVDARHIFEPEDASDAGLVFRGIGRLQTPPRRGSA